METAAALPSAASRRLVLEHARTVAEQADRHAVMLESILAVLRSTHLDDAGARRLAIDTATTALIQLRTVTDDDRSITGLLVSETPEDVVIFDGKEKKTIKVAEIEERVKLKQSSMPEGLAATLSPTELLDVIEFLKSRK